MTWARTSTDPAGPPADPIGEAVAEALSDLAVGATVELDYRRAGDGPTGDATGEGPPGWDVTIAVGLDERVAAIARSARETSLAELVERLPVAGIRAASRLRAGGSHAELPAAFRRAVRDQVATELLHGYLESRMVDAPRLELVADTIDYLIELSGTRVEAHDLTHGVVVADVFTDEPRLAFDYPADIRTAKRAPLLFDGQRAVLVVDPRGRARTELQRHRIGALAGEALPRPSADGALESGSLVADATRVVGGLGFFVRADRSIWTYVDGQPLLVRRGEHWTAFPLELSASISNMIGGAAVAALVAKTAFIISSQPRGAILAIVDDPADLDGVVALKDRFDLRGEVEPEAMRTETRLHHLIDVTPLDEHTLARLATLDGATILDREGRLVAYGAIVTTADSEHEGARTAAARTLSQIAELVLKVSVDGDITVFRHGRVVTTLLGLPSRP